MAIPTSIMIDIHTHILFGVDDGAKDLNMAIDMLKLQVSMGVTAVILTPHYSKFNLGKEDLFQRNFDILVEKVQSENIPIKLYLGKEVYFRELILEKKDHLTFEGSVYTLVEFSTAHEQNIEETIFNLKVLKLKPIVAHIERYPYLSKQDYVSIKKSGGLIQINSEALFGVYGFKHRRNIKFLFAEKLVDFVASDCHNLTNRKPNLKKAYQKVLKMYGKAYADKIFVANPKKILDSITL